MVRSHKIQGWGKLAFQKIKKVTGGKNMEESIDVSPTGYIINSKLYCRFQNEPKEKQIPVAILLNFMEGEPFSWATTPKCRHC